MIFVKSCNMEGVRNLIYSRKKKTVGIKKKEKGINCFIFLII
jgi:hypothetical protein